MSSNFEAIFKFYSKLSNFGKIIIFLVIYLIIYISFKKINKNEIDNNIEGFSTNENFIIKKNSDIYDDFYSNIYDYLVYNNNKNICEIDEIIKHTNVNNSSFILDVGSGTGHHTFMLNDKKYKTIGLDISPSMIKKSKQNFPNSYYKVGDALNPYMFNYSTFSHILCLYFTIYYFKNKRVFLENSFNWLNNGGYLVIHLVNKNTFDPILPPGNPLYIVSPQKYSKERITKTKINFNKFVYNANFDFNTNNDIVTFTERFKFNNGKVRKNELELTMEDSDNILATAQHCGFILKGKIDLIKCAYENQYLYILQKPF